MTVQKETPSGQTTATADDDWTDCVLCDGEFLIGDPGSYVDPSGEDICRDCTAELTASGDMEHRH